MTNSPLEPGELRIGDAERQLIAERIATAHALGQLEPDEFQERVEAAHSAKTQNELDVLVRDLPAAPSPVAKAWTATRRSDRVKAARAMIASVPRRVWIIALSVIAALGLTGLLFGLMDGDGRRGGRGGRGPGDIAERSERYGDGAHVVGAFFGGAISMLALGALVVGVFFLVRRLRSRRSATAA